MSPRRGTLDGQRHLPEMLKRLLHPRAVRNHGGFPCPCQSQGSVPSGVMRSLLSVTCAWHQGYMPGLSQWHGSGHQTYKRPLPGHRVKGTVRSLSATNSSLPCPHGCLLPRPRVNPCSISLAPGRVIQGVPVPHEVHGLTVTPRPQWKTLHCSISLPQGTAPSPAPY